MTRPPDHVEWNEGDLWPKSPTFRRSRWVVAPRSVFGCAIGSFSAELRYGSAKEAKMLVLSRKKNESIIINDDITIVVVEIRGDKVRLGVEAPKEVPVHRNEVYEAIRRNQGPNTPAGEPDATSAAE